MTPTLMVPGFGGSGSDHWQRIWAREVGARFVEQRDWNHPDRAEWVGSLDATITRSNRPRVLVAHSLGCLTVVHWAQAFAGRVDAAVLVAPTDAADPAYAVPATGFVPIPMVRLSFPALVIASDDDPVLTAERAREFAGAWGAEFRSAGEAGHLNAASGHGPWPEGRFLVDTFFKACGLRGL